MFHPIVLYHYGAEQWPQKKNEKSAIKDSFNVTDKMTLHISCVLIVQQNVCSRLKGLSTKAKLPSSEFLIIKKRGQANQSAQTSGTVV